MRGRIAKKMARVFVLLVLGLCLVTSASAQKKKGGGGVIRLEETIIEGRVQKPNAFFINTRQALVYEGMMLRESFVEEITKSVQDGEF